MGREDRAFDTILADIFLSDELAEAGHRGHHLVHRLIAGMFAGNGDGFLGKAGDLAHAGDETVDEVVSSVPGLGQFI